MASRRTQSSALVLSLLTFGPPGPPLRANWRRTASSGAKTPGASSMSIWHILRERRRGRELSDAAGAGFARCCAQRVADLQEMQRGVQLGGAVDAHRAGRCVPAALVAPWPWPWPRLTERFVIS